MVRPCAPAGIYPRTRGEVYLEVPVVNLSTGKTEENHQDGQDGQMGTEPGRRNERSLDPDRRVSLLLAGAAKVPAYQSCGLASLTKRLAI